MKRVKLVVAYDGTNYHGWQFQNNGVSIEEVLNQTLSQLLGETVAVIGASRTDSGVHAMGNVAVFDTENRMPADKISYALNQRLPEDIRIQSSCQVPLDWHPRKQNCVKTYEYKILNRRMEMPVNRLYTYFCYFPIDIEKMRQGAAYLVGEHDFKSFCTVRTQVEDTVRTIYSLDVSRGEDDVVVIRITGSGFLYNMVRIIAGTLLRVGTGLYPPEKVEEILEARNRQAAGPTLPAKGLTLIRLDYEEQLRPEIKGENKDWSYRLIQTEIPEKKKAYLLIQRCRDEEFSSLVHRVLRQAFRNGADTVCLTDQEPEKQRLKEGQQYGYSQLKAPYRFWEMEKKAEESSVETEIQLLPLSGEEEVEWCQMMNEIFFAVPNSSAYDLNVIKQEKEKALEFFWLRWGKEKAGGAVLRREEEKDRLYIDLLGIRKDLWRQGLGRSSLKAIEHAAKAWGLSQVALLTADSNQAAFQLYTSSGFTPYPSGTEWFEAVPLEFGRING